MSLCFGYLCVRFEMHRGECGASPCFNFQIELASLTIFRMIVNCYGDVLFTVLVHIIIQFDIFGGICQIWGVGNVVVYSSAHAFKNTCIDATHSQRVCAIVHVRSLKW